MNLRQPMPTLETFIWLPYVPYALDCSMARFRGYTSPRCEPTANADFEVEQERTQEAKQFPEERMRDSRAYLDGTGRYARDGLTDNTGMEVEMEVL